MIKTFASFGSCEIAIFPSRKNNDIQMKRIISFINPNSIYAKPVYFSNPKIENLRTEYMKFNNKKEVLMQLKEYANLSLKDIVPSHQKMALLDYYKLTEAYLFDSFLKPEFFLIDLTFMLFPLIYWQKQDSFLSWNQGMISLLYDEKKNNHQSGSFELLQYEDLSFDCHRTAISKLSDSIRNNYNKDRIIISQFQCDFIKFKNETHNFYKSRNFQDFRRFQIFMDEITSFFIKKIEGEMIIDFPYLNFFKYYDYSGTNHYPTIFHKYIEKTLSYYADQKLRLEDRILKAKVNKAKFSKKIIRKYYHKLLKIKPFVKNETTLKIINKFFILFFKEYQKGTIKKIINHKKNNGVDLIHPKFQRFHLNLIRKKMSINRKMSDYFINNLYFQCELRTFSQNNSMEFISIVYNFALMFELDPQNVFLILWKLLYDENF